VSTSVSDLPVVEMALNYALWDAKRESNTEDLSKIRIREKMFLKMGHLQIAVHDVHIVSAANYSSDSKRDF
jgi:hypothetical protein